MWKFIKKLFYTIAIISIFSIIWGRFFNPIITITQIEGLVKYQKLDRDYISFDEMGRNIKKAVIASEDQNFYRHNGFDFQAIQKAFADNQKGKKLKGVYHFVSTSVFGKRSKGSKVYAFFKGKVSK